MKKLTAMSKLRVKGLILLYKQIKASVETEIINGLVPMMQKYIANPLSR